MEEEQKQQNVKLEFVLAEEETREFWEQNKIFDKTLINRKKAKEWVFFEGPPTANYKPGVHHVLARVYKDLLCRYKTMRGFLVNRKAGWDTHGLPVELAIEKTLGLSSKNDIEHYGVAKFNKLAKDSVWKYVKDWEKNTEEIAYWVDLKHPYMTYDKNYMESVWWIIKQIDEKKLLYKGYKVVPFCPRCGTSLSSHEVAQGYETVKDPSVYVKMKLKESKDLFEEDLNLLVWTTTPWTLFANVAVAVNKDFNYGIYKLDDEYYISHTDISTLSFLKDRVVAKIKDIKGSELVGRYYSALYENKKVIGENDKTYSVVSAEFVSGEDGTGLVHIAPAFGIEDKELGDKLGLPLILNVDSSGLMMSGNNMLHEVEGMFFKDADPIIMKDLAKRGLCLHYNLQGTEHEYPFCWRCNTPLIYRANDTWFIKMSALKDQLIKNNQTINWVPEYLKEGRFGEWLKDIRDWALSRERYWGTPLPVWTCDKCKHQETIGSIKELDEKANTKTTFYYMRHGESVSNVREVVSSYPTPFVDHVTEKGKENIKKAIDNFLKLKIKIDLIVTSDILRTKETAEMMADALGCPLIYEERLREINFGEYNGKSAKKALEFFRHESREDFESFFPGGESLAQKQKDAMAVLFDLQKKYPGQTIMVVSHKGVIKLMEAKLTGEEPVDYMVDETWPRNSEIGKLSYLNAPYNPETQELDLHKPYVDDFYLKCPVCGGLMKRTKEVIDCWFDSGSMPFSQIHYPFEKDKFKFPAEFICEGIDQTRGWFYTLLAISTCLGMGVPYKNVLSLGLILDEKGEKMSKSKGNMLDPEDLLAKYGADTLRWYLYSVNSPGEAKKFSEKDLISSQRRFLNTIWNVYKFYETYAHKGRNLSLKELVLKVKSLTDLDKWILARLEETKLEYIKSFDKYDTYKVTQLLDLLVDDLSRWYLRRSRKRLQLSDDKRDYLKASLVLGTVLKEVSKLMAPFSPYISELIWQRLKDFKDGKSVHLTKIEEAREKLIDRKLINSMNVLRDVANKALKLRQEIGIKVRQPLASLNLKKRIIWSTNLKEILMDEINVKKISFNPKLKEEIALDKKLTPVLIKEGQYRELVRTIQGIRQEMNLTPKDRVILSFTNVSEEIKKFLLSINLDLCKEVKAKKLVFTELDSFINKREIEILDKTVVLSIG